MSKRLQFAILALVTFILLATLRRCDVLAEWSQVAAVAIFATSIYATLLFSERRLAFAASGIALLLCCNLLSVSQFVRSANLSVIIFLVGTFLIVGYLEESLFFEHVVGSILHAVGPRPRLVMPVLVLTSTIASALIGEVASTLFMAGAVLHLCDRYKVRPLPFVMAVVFAVNCGSAASSVGPIGVTIALRAGLSFGDFLRWAAPIALAASFLSLGVCRLYFATEFREFEAAVRSDHAPTVPKDPANASPGDSLAQLSDPETETRAQERAFDEGMAVPSGSSRTTCWLVLGATVVLFVSHSWLESLLRLERDTMLVAAALIMGSVVLFLRGRGARQLLERRVDWWTLCFFMLLFAAVGTLEQTHVTGVAAQRIMAVSQTGGTWLAQIVGWATGLLSAFLDNLLAVATFLPVVDEVRRAGHAACPQAVYWMMLFGGTFMGNMTLIGSTANIIACGMIDKRGHGPVRFWQWFKVGLPVSVLSMAVATVLLGVQTGWFTRPLMPAP